MTSKQAQHIAEHVWEDMTHSSEFTDMMKAYEIAFRSNDTDLKRVSVEARSEIIARLANVIHEVSNIELGI